MRSSAEVGYATAASSRVGSNGQIRQARDTMGTVSPAGSSPASVKA